MKLHDRSPWVWGFVLVAFAICPMRAEAYEVWIGTLGWQQGMATHPDDWKRTAESVHGMNVNWAHGQPDPNHLEKGRRGEVVAMLTHAKEHAYQVTPHGTGAITDAKDWERAFDRAQGAGYKLEHLHTYSSGKGKSWKPAEHEVLRKWLDQHGHTDVKISFNGRSGKGVLERAVVQSNGIECDLKSWKENKGDRHELLRWMADPNNPDTKDEKIFIHCHLNYGKGKNEADLVDAWVGARLMVRDIGRDVLNTDELRQALRSDRLVFCFFGGNWTTPHLRAIACSNASKC